MSCGRVQERMAALVAGGVGRRERLELEAHARRCARCATALADLASVSIALDRAYQPLRDATIALSPARVRLALRAPARTPASVRLSGATRRFSEVALAAAVTVFAFISAAPIAPEPAIVDEAASVAAPIAPVPAGDLNVARWLRIGRYAEVTDVADRAVTLHLSDEEIATPGAARSGLAR